MEREASQNINSISVHKKIIFCGPPGAGKTTLKQIFFEKANPLRLLTTTLEPTKGFERSLYHQLYNEIAVFDLGGQENNRWFGQDQEIIQWADLIMYVCPVTTPLNEVISFLHLLSRAIDHKSHEVKFVILYHKRDLITIPELTQRIKQLRQFIKTELPEIQKQVVFYVTSVAEPFFFATYRIFGEILRRFINHEIVSRKTISYQQAELELRILLEFQPEIKYHINNLLSRFHLSPINALQILDRLKEMNLVEFFYAPNSKVPDNFQLTEQAKFFVASIRKNLIYPNKISDNVRSSQKIVDIFSQLNKTYNL